MPSSIWPLLLVCNVNGDEAMLQELQLSFRSQTQKKRILTFFFFTRTISLNSRFTLRNDSHVSGRITTSKILCPIIFLITHLSLDVRLPTSTRYSPFQIWIGVTLYRHEASIFYHLYRTPKYWSNSNFSPQRQITIQSIFFSFPQAHFSGNAQWCW